ncbi:MAG: cupredoxin domain-containing protein [Anaerolineales bacterium]|nr:cupredoxin domain-containing protein [Anaerolineales bacterium]
MSEHDETVYRTSPGRVGKLMTILVGLVVVGSVIYFSMGDYWISELSPAGQAFAGITDEPTAPAVVQTGADIPITLDFIESKDFRTLAFNALPGEPGNNPTINAKVGDRIIFNILNAGKSFHEFGVTLDEEGFGGILGDSAVASPNSPLKPGEGGASEFIPGEPGTYYYICTVPGHREMGMVGIIIVE